MSLHRLTATDGVWLSLESADMPMHIAFLLEFTAPEGGAAQFLRQWRAGLDAPASLPQPWNFRPLKFPPPGVAALVREVDDIDLSEHIREWTLPEPGSQDQLTELVASIHQKQLDMSRPPWELHVIEGLAQDRFALLLKVHHSLLDGASAMRLFTDTFTEDAAARDVPDLFTVRPAAESGQAEKANPFRSLLTALTGVLALLRGVGSAARDAFRLARGDKTMAQQAYQQPETILDGTITGARDLSRRRYDLALFKQLAKAGDCTINDIVLYLVSTGLRTYLTDHATLPEESLTAGVPTDLRAEDDARAGTRAGMMFTALATDIADPRDRLSAVKYYIRAAKQHMGEMAPNEVIGYGLAVTLPWILGLSFGFTNTAASHPMGISNVPGPRNPLYWNGARLETIYPISLLMHGNPLNFTCIGYSGALHFGVLGVRDKLPPMSYLTGAMDVALDELTDLLLPGRTQLAAG
ncbi:wax ester/triacylglycerol synthase family O-acyltransferase [Nocardia anaemiae]|uniref:wax ester/triacylglycerol synthase family O-acyltransferase n=1 Tax=Nocardia anaemiae TaxID=263910 RepID=UPI0007A3E849|nr:wax ester/triacylglycerol synthase family O-acyltransferase [Nocardia anaemiae]